MPLVAPGCIAALQVAGVPLSQGHDYSRRACAEPLTQQGSAQYQCQFQHQPACLGPLQGQGPQAQQPAAQY